MTLQALALAKCEEYNKRSYDNPINLTLEVLYSRKVVYKGTITRDNAEHEQLINDVSVVCIVNHDLMSEQVITTRYCIS